MTTLAIPDFCLVILIGASAPQRAAFAARHFRDDERVSAPRAADSTAPLEHAEAAVAERLSARRLTIVNGENRCTEDRRRWLQLARAAHAPAVAVVLDDGVATEELLREGFRRVHRLAGAQTASAAVSRRPLRVDRRPDLGPFDIIGDVHGCAEELEKLLELLGYRVERDPAAGEGYRVRPPPGRKAVFVGDLVDRGPRVPDVLRLVMSMTREGSALCVMGNHDDKLLRWLDGRKVRISHGLEASIEPLERESAAFRARVRDFLGGLADHYWLDQGRLCVAHAGLDEEKIGRSSGAVRAFALYGDTNGERDEYGLPVRRDWAARYRGATRVVYGHTPVSEAVWRNNTLCLDTGCVFGGALTALRYPENELVSVPARRVYYESLRPFARVAAGS
ncbi:MAG TPA: metallophosphoesterase [Pseudomonadales bacterium]